MKREKLHDWIKKRHGRGAWLAKKLGIHRQSLHAMLTGKRTIDSIQGRLADLIAKRAAIEKLLDEK